MENESFSFQMKKDVNINVVILEQLIHMQEVQTRQEIILTTLLHAQFPEEEIFDKLLNSFHESAKSRRYELLANLVKLYGE